MFHSELSSSSPFSCQKNLLSTVHYLHKNHGKLAYKNETKGSPGKKKKKKKGQNEKLSTCNIKLLWNDREIVPQ